jgi:hypothetical protein
VPAQIAPPYWRNIDKRKISAIATSTGAALYNQPSVAFVADQ